jgi:hypothetical protein
MQGALSLGMTGIGYGIELERSEAAATISDQLSAGHQLV